MSKPMVSVCVGSIRPQTLPATIESICRQTYSNWELIVVGQGDEPGLRAFAESAPVIDGRIRYVHSERKGLSLARNLGIACSGGEIIAMTDDDCEAQEDWLETTVGRFARDNELMLVGGTVQKPARPHRVFATCPAFSPAEAVYRPGKDAAPPVGWDFMGANFAFRRTLFEQTGPFDEHLGAGATFPAAEDTDFKLRAEQVGATMLSTPASVVVHSHGYRYGLRSLLNSSRNYAQGNGALAAKLTLQGDPRGMRWLEDTRRKCIGLALRKGRLHRLPGNWRRLHYLEEAYRRCLRDFEVDSATKVLSPRKPALTGPAVRAGA